MLAFQDFLFQGNRMQLLVLLQEIRELLLAIAVHRAGNRLRHGIHLQLGGQLKAGALSEVTNTAVNSAVTALTLRLHVLL
jgi:hypothetical protein